MRQQICPEEPEGQDSGEYSLRGGTWVMPSRFTDQDAQEIEERECPCLLSSARSRQAEWGTGLPMPEGTGAGKH